MSKRRAGQAAPERPKALPKDLETRDENGNTALMLAVFNRRPSAVRTLLKFKIDINKVSNDGQTALSIADKMAMRKCLRCCFKLAQV